MLQRILNSFTTTTFELAKCSICTISKSISMDSKKKREHEESSELDGDKIEHKCMKHSSTQERDPKLPSIKHGKGRLVPQNVLNKLTEDELRLLEDIKSSSTDLSSIQAAIQLRIKHRLSVRLPEDAQDSSYYIEAGLRKVYPYQYLYQSYAKRRWIGRKFKDVLKEEFRDLSEEQMKWRFDKERVLVNGKVASYDYVLRDNDSVANRTHRHELPVLATPIKIIHQDKDTLVIDKPPSVPIHPCGRYRHNSVINILRNEYKFEEVKVVHRLDRLVSGVLIIARNSARAHYLEQSIKNRNVQKEYVCRVEGEFPIGKPEDNGEITVDQPLETIPGKIGITVVLPNGKESLTKFKRLNYNGKTSAVLCKPKTGRMHQIRVHLQYLGHPIVNDGLYNCSSFGPEKGKNGNYGKGLKQLSSDVISMHRANTWLMSEEADVSDYPSERLIPHEKVVEFVSDKEREETMAALAHCFTSESWQDLEHKWRFDPNKFIKDPTCRDCQDKFYDPPLRSLFLYLHALKYSGDGWCYESEMPVWARESWKY